MQIRNHEESESESSDSDSDSDDDQPQHKVNVQWHVTPDLGELDDHSTLYREWDSPDYLNKMKPKFSGWSNPLSWTDSGDDDDQVLVLMKDNEIEEKRISDKVMLQYLDGKHGDPFEKYRKPK